MPTKCKYPKARFSIWVAGRATPTPLNATITAHEATNFDCRKNFIPANPWDLPKHHKSSPTLPKRITLGERGVGFLSVRERAMGLKKQQRSGPQFSLEAHATQYKVLIPLQMPCVKKVKWSGLTLPKLYLNLNPKFKTYPPPAHVSNLQLDGPDHVVTGGVHKPQGHDSKTAHRADSGAVWTLVPRPDIEPADGGKTEEARGKSLSLRANDIIIAFLAPIDASDCSNLPPEASMHPVLAFLNPSLVEGEQTLAIFIVSNLTEPLLFPRRAIGQRWSPSPAAAQEAPLVRCSVNTEQITSNGGRPLASKFAGNTVTRAAREGHWYAPILPSLDQYSPLALSLADGASMEKDSCIKMNSA